MLIDAREYVGANQKTVLPKAGLELQKVDCGVPGRSQAEPGLWPVGACRGPGSHCG